MTVAGLATTTLLPDDLAEAVAEWAARRGVSGLEAMEAVVRAGLESDAMAVAREELELRRLRATAEKVEHESRKRAAEAAAAEADVFGEAEVLAFLGATCEVFRGELRGLSARFRHLLEGAGVPNVEAGRVLRDIEDRLVAGVADAFKRGDPRERGET